MANLFFIHAQFSSTPGKVTTVPITSGADMISAGIATNTPSPGFKRSTGFLSVVFARQINNEVFELEIPLGSVVGNPVLLPLLPPRRPTAIRFRQDEGFRAFIIVRMIVEF